MRLKEQRLLSSEKRLHLVLHPLCHRAPLRKEQPVQSQDGRARPPLPPQPGHLVRGGEVLEGPREVPGPVVQVGPLEDLPPHVRRVDAEGEQEDQGHLGQDDQQVQQGQPAAAPPFSEQRV